MAHDEEMPIAKSKLKYDRELGTGLDDWSMTTDYDLPWQFDTYGGDEEWTPDEMKEMLRRDGKARTLQQVLTLPVRSAPFEIEPSPNSGMNVREQNKMIEEIRHLLDHMEDPMEDIIGLMTGAFIYKRAFFEKVYTRVDGKIGYKRIAWRPQWTSTPIREKKDKGRIKGFRQRRVDLNGMDDVKILNPYAFVYTHGRAENPIHGVSEFEVAYRCYVTKEKIKYLWSNFIEGQALPRVVVKGDNKEGVKRAVTAISRLKNSGIAGIPKDWAESIDTLDVSGKGSAEFKAALDWFDREAAGSILAGFTELPNADSGNGSYALSSDQTDFFLQMQRGNARELAMAIKKGIITDIAKLNWGKDAVVPEVRIGPLAREDITAQVQMLVTMASTPQESSRVPIEFIEELTIKVAEALEMDIDKLIKAQKKLKKDIQEAGMMTDADFAGIQAGVDTLMNASGQAMPRASEQLEGGGPSGRGVVPPESAI